ncbi:MAG: hypothetical protein A3B99_00775 [Candidatus Yanofskybacteria bacterium RIFCSPHIGHO2_02_FULL_44_12b]|uniref:Uncharacterized protein n=2 Tax=Candidatus Yanofskyibacteriota TaxID=1752733 RepID=A0A1F8GKI4_9BACT|nr:MAG: hypothetical protein UW79_C0004G0018 [Candidatus Yanofskybacteria bacterium GW2011_GWA2_44_9]OGN05341.1 MAG: hypothetical protein A2659_01925 [Candidatus Yanofskybacteria bacterium RIFCSPHIGHO2_01_FULL_44_24]OGN16009.1 MAG: hypothetical protein A3B99_00775 [Candidatus Yanofskybacteria bacterium RIFCSPHIGHO2_02_FULL_44_12b]OGN25520.1 MAG: hypothetical protein A2925_02220 [Candidatus Yanofskybacteria bacterium RIFCSPLOWO2_01_FULL_44_22]
MIDAVGISGLVLVSIAIWLKKEKGQDILFILGGGLLLIYSAYLKNTIFIVLQGVFILSALLELLKLNKK